MEREKGMISVQGDICEGYGDRIRTPMANWLKAVRSHESEAPGIHAENRPGVTLKWDQKSIASTGARPV